MDECRRAGTDGRKEGGFEEGGYSFQIKVARTFDPIEPRDRGEKSVGSDGQKFLVERSIVLAIPPTVAVAAASSSSFSSSSSCPPFSLLVYVLRRSSLSFRLHFLSYLALRRFSRCDSRRFYSAFFVFEDTA